MIMKLLLLFVTAILMAGCDAGLNSDQQAREVAGKWADAYFNCDFKDADNYVTPESRKWLQYAASNTTEQELNMLQEAGGAQVTVSETATEGNDTLKTFRLTVANCLGTTHETAALVKERTFMVTVVRRTTDWQVRMAGLPQSERQSRD